MDFHHRNMSPSSSSSSTTSSVLPNALTTITAAATTGASPTANAADDPMHSWWESISKARVHIQSLSTVLELPLLSSLADSDRPALSLLSSADAYSAVSSALSSSSLSGSGSDPLCHWLYDTFLSSDPHLRLVVLSFLPLLSGLYLSRIHSDPSPTSLAGFEAVLLALYSSECKGRSGKPSLISIPDLSQPSLYHVPRPNRSPTQPPGTSSTYGRGTSVGVLCPPLEPQIAVKSTKRATIVGVALDCYYKQISQMPAWSKLELCRFAAAWAGQDCSCRREFDGKEEDKIGGFELKALEDRRSVDGDDYNDDYAEIDGVVGEIRNLEIEEQTGVELEPKGARIPLPWELLQPVLRILGHCLLAPLNAQEVKDAASFAVRSLYARALHDLVPQAILATRSLIQLDKRAREAAKAAAAAAAAANASSNANTPSKAKKPEILLMSK